MQAVGSRRQVFNGSARRTSGGLTKKDLMKNKFDRIVSVKKHRTAKKDNRLVKAGYGTRKGHFGWVRIGDKKTRKHHKKSKDGKKHHKRAHKSRRHRGGHPPHLIW